MSVAEVEVARISPVAPHVAGDGALPRNERLEVARELHDVVSHTIAAINLQASVALHLLDQGAGRAAESLHAIKDTSRDALQELRGILAKLTQADSEPDAVAVSLVSRLEHLVGGTRNAGVDARLQIAGSPRELPLTVSQAAYRVVQESLTNVLRHAGATSAEVALTFGADDVVVEITDDGAGGATAESPGSGLGLAGMRDRVQGLGGSFAAGPRDVGGFGVLAQVPDPTRS